MDARNMMELLTESENIKTSTPTTFVGIGKRKAYERDYFKDELAKIDSLDGKWQYASTYEMTGSLKDMDEYERSIAEYVNGITELLQMTLDMMGNDLSGGHWADNPKEVLENVGAAEQRLLDKFENMPWDIDIDLRYGLWIDILFCASILNFKTQMKSRWRPMEPDNLIFVKKSQYPVAKYPQSLILGCIFLIQRDWNRIRFSKEFLELVHRLRLRVATMATMASEYKQGYDEPGMFTEARIKLVRKDESTGLNVKTDVVVYKPNKDFLMKTMFFFYDFERAVIYREKFLNQFNVNNPEMLEPLSKAQQQKLDAWGREVLEGVEQNLLPRYRKRIFSVLIRPGDVDSFRNDDKKQVLYGTDIDTTSAVNAESVYNTVHKTESMALVKFLGESA